MSRADISVTRHLLALLASVAREAAEHHIAEHRVSAATWWQQIAVAADMQAEAVGKERAQ